MGSQRGNGGEYARNRQSIQIAVKSSSSSISLGGPPFWHTECLSHLPLVSRSDPSKIRHTYLPAHLITYPKEPVASVTGFFLFFGN
jgi:hypothetical protein